MRWILLHLHLADEETEEKPLKVMQQGRADPGFELRGQMSEGRFRSSHVPPVKDRDAELFALPYVRC